MAIIIKTPQEIAKMRIAGQLAADVLEMIEPHVVSGVTTIELNTICHDYIVVQRQAIPAPLNYHGFPKSICTSINHQVCHGIPDGRRLKDGDIVNIDITVIKDGFHGDTSKMFLLGKPGIMAQRLCRIANETMWKGIETVCAGTHFGTIGNAIQRHVESNRYSVVREYCGHGIGRGFHEAPQVLHYGVKDSGMKMQAGMIFTIEPMINVGKHKINLLSDGWTVVTKDRKLSAQWEHTILVTETGYDVLTLRNEEKAAHPAARR